MPAVTNQQLIDAGADCNTIGAIANSAAPTTLDRLGQVRPTMSGLAAEYPAASGNAAAALASQAAAAASEASALAAKTQAEAARDAALVGANSYASEALGRAAVADGASFKVQGAGDVAVFEYRRINSTTSALIATYPSVAGINAKFQITDGVLGLSEPVAQVFEDAEGKVSAHVDSLGRWRFNANAGLNAASDSFDQTQTDTDWQVAVTDTADKIAFGIRANGQVFADFTLPPAQATHTDVYHIVLHGQSLAEGDDALPIVSTTDAGWGSYKFGRGVRTWSAADNPTTPAARSGAGFGFTPLVADASGGFGETIANGLADGYKAGFGGRYAVVPQATVSPNVLVTYAGRGSTRLTQLNAEDTGRTDVRDTWASPGGYWLTLLDDVTRAKATALASGKSYAVAGLVYMQGERDSDLKIYEWDTALAPSAHFAAWRDKFKTLATDFDSSVRGITGQLRKVPTFVYQTSNHIVGNAQLAAANEHADIYMVGPTYAVASAINGSYVSGTQVWGNGIHLTADGSRWYGEQCAKVMRRVLAEKEDWKPLMPLRARKVSASVVDVDFHVPRAPLVVDTAFLAKARGFGFAAYGGTIDALGTRCDVSAVEVLAGGTTARFTFSTALPAGAFFRGGVFSTCDLGISPAVASTAAASNSAAGFTRFALTLTGNHLATLQPLTNEGAFNIYATNAQGVIRSVSLVSGDTVLVGENRELRTGGSYRSFAPADVLEFGRHFAYTNLRDSDNEAAVNSFANTSYGTRSGLYPLQNWCTFFDNLTITGA